MRPIRHILVPTDFGPAANAALEQALDLARGLGAKITLLHVAWVAPSTSTACAEDFTFPVRDLEDKARNALESAAARARATHTKVETLLAGGEVWQTILTAAHDRGADLVVMGTHGRRGLPRFLIGSVAERVVRLSTIPVLVVPVAA
jgi:nucleotide-binding universal stress UspA family protein